MEDPEIRRTTIVLEGRRAVVDTIVTLLRYIEVCGRFGTTRYVEMMVDGDGGGQIGLWVDGAEAPLSPAEELYLLEGVGERPASLVTQDVVAEARGGDTILKVELV